MGELRERMAVDLRLRGLSAVTPRMYLGCVERFVAHHRRSPKALGEAEIRRDPLSLSGDVDGPVTVRRIPFPRRDGERLPEI